jgi:hypothetical protein
VNAICWSLSFVGSRYLRLGLRKQGIDRGAHSLGPLAVVLQVTYQNCHDRFVIGVSMTLVVVRLTWKSNECVGLWIGLSWFRIETGGGHL